MTIHDYIGNISKRYKTGISREHSYRGELQRLIESISPSVLVTNEPAHIECGAPDYIITKGKIPIGYIEAKDIGKPLDSKEYKEQFDRYKKSLDNLIITDYLD
ncbi:MAG: DNA methyltransferase, partial [Bacteroidetes bacterium]|nr:DNA methyltransferase [Bacteroidota bacterium]